MRRSGSVRVRALRARNARNCRSTTYVRQRVRRRNNGARKEGGAFNARAGVASAVAGAAMAAQTRRQKAYRKRAEGYALAGRQPKSFQCTCREGAQVVVFGVLRQNHAAQVNDIIFVIIVGMRQRRFVCLHQRPSVIPRHEIYIRSFNEQHVVYNGDILRYNVRSSSCARQHAHIT